MYKIHRGTCDKIPNQTKIKKCCASKTCKTQSRFNVSNDSNGQVHGEIGCSDRLARRRFVHWAHVLYIQSMTGWGAQVYHFPCQIQILTKEP